MSEKQAIPEARAPGRYLRNCWYVAGWADDLGASPLARTFLDEPVALFRDGDGVAHAIAGRCPHRFAPLGHGQIVDGALQCPYHGLRFDGSGACVFNPHESGVVPRSRCRSIRWPSAMLCSGSGWARRTAPTRP